MILLSPVKSKGSVQGVGGWGVKSLRGPIGGEAKGIPWNDKKDVNEGSRVFLRDPQIGPFEVWTNVGSSIGSSAFTKEAKKVPKKIKIKTDDLMLKSKCCLVSRILPVRI